MMYVREEVLAMRYLYTELKQRGLFVVVYVLEMCGSGKC